MIIPSEQRHLPLAPNFFVEVKGPWGCRRKAKTQAMYIGAFGARGLLSLHSYYLPSHEPDNAAYTLSCIYQGGILEILAVHPMRRAGSGKDIEYATTRVGIYLLTKSIHAFREGASALRNGIDWAKEQRDNAINTANERHSNGCESSSAGESLPASPVAPGRTSTAETSHQSPAAATVSIGAAPQAAFAAESTTDMPPPSKRSRVAG